MTTIVRRLRAICCIGLALSTRLAGGRVVPLQPLTVHSDIVLNETAVTWPSPDSLAAALLSPTDTRRLQAFETFGLRRQQIWEVVFAGPNPLPNEQVAFPEQVQLRYARLGRDALQQAILAVQVQQSVYVAVATKAGASWQRIALSGFWAKYEAGGGDALARTVGLITVVSQGPATPGQYELVLRSSGGGTGVYEQEEAHFRLQSARLRNVLSFKSEKRACDASVRSQRCTVSKVSATLEDEGAGSGLLLVERRGSFPGATQPKAVFEIPALQERFLRMSACSFFLWNEAAFRYTATPETSKDCPTEP